jgi:hypothetical protein
MGRPQIVTRKKIVTNTNEENLVAAWDMRQNGITINDASLNTNNGTVSLSLTSSTVIGDAMTFFGRASGGGSILVSDHSSMNALTGTVSALIKKNDWSSGQDGWIINRGGTSSPNLQIWFLSGSNLLVAGVVGGTNCRVLVPTADFVNDRWMHLVLTYSRSSVSLYIDSELIDSDSTANTFDLSGLDLYIGSKSTVADEWDGQIGQVKLYSDIKDQTWITREYNKIKNIKWLMGSDITESTASVTSGPLENSGFRVTSGSWQINDELVNGKTVPVIECVTAGVCLIPIVFFNQSESEAAYGTWDFCFSKDGASQPKIFFAADNTNQNDYYIRLMSTEIIQLRKTVAGAGVTLWATSADTFPIDTWTNLKITRAGDGTFTSYMDGTLIPVISGTNPVVNTEVTSVQRIKLELDAGDKIALIKKNISVV